MFSISCIENLVNMSLGKCNIFCSFRCTTILLYHIRISATFKHICEDFWSPLRSMILYFYIYHFDNYMVSVMNFSELQSTPFVEDAENFKITRNILGNMQCMSVFEIFICALT